MNVQHVIDNKVYKGQKLIVVERFIGKRSKKEVFLEGMLINCTNLVSWSGELSGMVWIMGVAANGGGRLLDIEGATLATWILKLEA